MSLRWNLRSDYPNITGVPALQEQDQLLGTRVGCVIYRGIGRVVHWIQEKNFL